MRYALFPIFAIAASLTACGDDSATAPVPFAGTWSLRTWGGRPLPTSQIGGLGLRTDILGGSLSIAADGTWSETLTLYVVTSTGAFDRTATSHGTYSPVGTFIHFIASDNPEYMDCQVVADALMCDDGQVSYTR